MDWEMLKVKGWIKVEEASTHWKNAGIVILSSDKISLKTKTIAVYTETIHDDEESIYEENTRVTFACTII